MAKVKKYIFGADSACVDRMKSAGKNYYGDEEFLDEVEDIYNAMIRTYNESEGLLPWRRAKQVDDPEAEVDPDVQSRAAELLKQEKELNKLHQIHGEMTVIRDIIRLYPDSARAGIISMIGSVSGRNDISSASIANGVRQSWHSQLMKTMSEEDWNILNRGKLDREIRVALYDVHYKRTTDGIPEQAYRIARGLVDLEDTMVGELNAKGATIGRVANGITRQQHNKFAIADDKEGWKAFVRANLDYEASFGQPLGEIDADWLELKLENWWSELSSGTFEMALSGQAGSASNKRSIIWKDGNADYEYFTRYGRESSSDTLKHGVDKRITKNSREFGLLWRFGPNYEATIINVRNSMVQHLKQKAADDPANADMYNRQIGELAEGKFNYQVDLDLMNGRANSPVSETTHKVNGWLKSWNVMRLLGSTVFSMFGDIPATGNVMARMYRQDGGRVKSLYRSLEAWWGENLSNLERNAQARALGIDIETMGGQFMNDISQADPQLGFMAKAGAFFNKVSLVGPVTDRIRAANGISFAAQLGDYAGSTMDQISADVPRVATTIKQWGLDKYWPYMKDMRVKSDDSDMMIAGWFLDPSEIRRMDLNSPVLQQAAADLGVSARTVRDDVATRLLAGMNELINAASPKPNLRSKAWMRLGSNIRAGTGGAIINDQLWTFKGFFVSQISQNIMRDFRQRYYENIENGLSYREGNAWWNKGPLRGDAEWGSFKAGMAPLGLYIAQASLFGSMGLFLRDLSKGQQRDWAAPESWMQGAIAGGGLGIFGDFLLGDMKNRFGGSALDTLVGPTASTFSGVVDIAQRLRDQDDVGAASLRLMHSMLPFQNYFASRLAVSHFMLEPLKEELNPGSVQRSREAMRKNTEIEYLVEPR